MLKAELKAVQEIIAPDGPIRLPNTAYDEVLEGVYIGEKGFAMDKDKLKRLGITYVLNAAEGTGFGKVDTGKDFYDDDVTYMGIRATDVMGYDMEPHFRLASEFIKTAVSGGHKILVHCVQGVSRSASLVIAYCMLDLKMTLKEAVARIRAKRNVCPNTGFLKQLIQFEQTLQK
ncbi:dual specificity protein phosphatase 3-like [Oscarella lobularis]|uniref:dual specificity protein phosphatase 3-like n=1 Tax=Oscarella lobularis TaxID=121494 RepID=UPI00331367E1